MSNETTENQHAVQRHLKDRHISMIAIGGAIGTGLFMTSGGAIHDAGPLGALLGYAIIGVMVFFLMTSLGKWRRIYLLQVRLAHMPRVLSIRL